MSATTFIYCLCEPGTKTIRYFGKADNPKERRNRHVRNAKAGENRDWHVTRWIRKLLEFGQRPDVHTLCEVPQDDFERFERAFIAIGRQCGMDLTNLTDGGEGTSGWRHSMRTRAKMSVASAGKPKTPEHCANMRKPKTPEHRAKASAQCAAMSAAKRGKKRPPFSPKHLANMSAAQKGKKPSPEHRAKISASLKKFHVEKANGQ